MREGYINLHAFSDIDMIPFSLLILIFSYVKTTNYNFPYISNMCIYMIYDLLTLGIIDIMVKLDKITKHLQS